MILRFFFNQLSLHSKIEYLRKKGILVGKRIKKGRTAYIYMLKNLFVEVIYQYDNPDELPEKLKTLSGLKNLNQYLENEFKASF